MLLVMIYRLRLTYHRLSSLGPKLQGHEKDSAEKTFW